MVEYGIVTTNKFHFLSDDEGADPSEILGKAAQIKKVKGTSTTKVPQNTAPVATNIPKPEKPQVESANKENAVATRGGRGRGRGRGEGGASRDSRRDDKREEKVDGGEQQQRRGGDGERRGGRGTGGRGRGRVFDGDRQPRDGERRTEMRHGDGSERRGRGNGDRERRPFDTDRERRPFDSDRERRPRHFENNDNAPAVEGEERTEVRGMRGGRGGGNRRGGSFRGDRMSHSDRSTVRGAEKKSGHGTGNWGTEQDELQGETEPIVEATDAEKPTEEDIDTGDKNDSGVEVEKEEEKQPVGITFSEWKEKNKMVETETFNIRKPNDDKKLNLAPLKKISDTDKNTDEYTVIRREPREARIDISVNFSTAERGTGGRGRGDREGFRGGAGNRGSRGGDREQRGEGRSGDRGGRGNRGARSGGNNQFTLASEQFPALGAH